MAGSRKWAQGMGHDPVLAEEDAPVTQLQFRYVWKGGGEGKICCHHHRTSTHFKRQYQIQPESLRFGELGDAACGGWRADLVRFSRCPTDTTSDHCLGHQNHLHHNRSWSMGWVPPAVPPFTCQAFARAS